MIAPRFSATSLSLFTWRSGRIVIESFGSFPHNAASNEPLECAQPRLIFRRDEADRVTNGVRTTRAADAMDLIL